MTQCTNKVSYPTQSWAEETARFASRRFGTPQRAYRCPSCSLWHLARKKFRGKDFR